MYSTRVGQSDLNGELVRYCPIGRNTGLSPAYMLSEASVKPRVSICCLADHSFLKERSIYSLRCDGVADIFPNTGTPCGYQQESHPSTPRRNINGAPHMNTQTRTGLYVQMLTTHYSHTKPTLFDFCPRNLTI